jgi:hypothetical protein
MRLQHAEKTAGSLPSETPEQARAKAVIVAEVDRLHWRIWRVLQKHTGKEFKMNE